MTTTITRNLLLESLKENDAFAQMVLENKYAQGEEKDLVDIRRRISKITRQELGPEEGTLEHAIDELIMSGKYIPAGSILYGLGATSPCSLSNCYFTPILEDSLEGIFDAIKHLARTFSYRGGSGITLNILRPKDTRVNNAAKASSGAVSFMPNFNWCVKSIGQNGRRGALLMSMDIRHPDSPLFILAKHKPELVFERDAITGELPNIEGANLSLMVTEAFMDAVQDDEDFELWFPDIEAAGKAVYEDKWDGDFDAWEKAGLPKKVYKVFKARELMRMIAESAHACGDPGLIFKDTVEDWTLSSHIDAKLRPRGANPCSEQPLSDWENCLLGCMVLPYYIIDGVFNYEMFLKDIRTAVFIMNVYSRINRDRHPLKQQREADYFSRRVGIEMTGVADAVAMLGMRYGSEEACNFLSDLAKKKAIKELEASVEAVTIFGMAPALASETARKGLVESQYYKNLVDGYECADILTQAILGYGMANTALNTMGPCGSISIISGNCTSGGEPLYKFSYGRKNKIDRKTYEFIHRPAVVQMLADFKRFEGKTLEEAKEMLHYVEANEVDPIHRIQMQSTLQEYTDASISSTLNLPEITTVEDITKIYREAHQYGLKGVTVFRENCKVGVLSAISDKPATPVPVPGVMLKRGLLDTETATRHRVFWKKAKLYVIVSSDGDEQPIEVFAKLPVEAGSNGDGQFNPTLWQERTSNWDLACRLISLLLRYGVPLEEVIEQLQKSAYTMVDVASVLKRILARYRVPVEHLEDEEGETIEVHGLKCPECKQLTFFHEGGCDICRECGFTTCG